jgi:hypothetical protein
MYCSASSWSGLDENIASMGNVPTVLTVTPVPVPSSVCLKTRSPVVILFPVM